MNYLRDVTDARRLERIEEVFFAVLSQPEHVRDDCLGRLCAGDVGLRSAVEKLLRADDDSGGVIDDHSWRAAHLAERLRGASDDDPLAVAGAAIGGYRLLERIGVGGMGAVWSAQRADDAFDRTVAVKLIKRGLDTDEVLRRFRLERQVLARLEHPNIARLYDGGATDDGRPYLVMEYVKGVPIDQYCRECASGIDQIVELIRSVCNTVQYAHAHLVLHRDIKPANVLVTAGPTVKLLDFGIAKVLSDESSSVTVTSGDPVFTPRYASPEQIRGERLTTASDVYSLGVLAYELLTGQSPYGAHARTRCELERAVLHETPPAASAAALRAGSRATSRRLRGDLELILGRALAKSPIDRYPSAAQLAEDFRRRQEGLPLLTRGLSRTGRFVRLLRRHRRGVLTAALAAVAALAVGITAVSYWFMMPRWAQENIRAARREFLSPELSNAIWALTFNNAESQFSREKRPACPLTVADAAVAAYDAALKLDWNLDAVRIERDTVWLAAEISRSTSSPPDAPTALRRATPLTCAYASEWVDTGLIPELTDAQFDAAESIDLRSLGLLAILCGDLRNGIQAWSRLGEYESDPLVDSLLGVLYLASDQPQRAYPRLLSAYREHPELGFLCVYVADAAIAVGDVALAGQLLNRAATLEHADPQEAHRRVQLRYYLATGQADAADRLFSEPSEHDNPVLRRQYARYLFDAGHQRRGLAILGEVCGGTPSYRQTPAAIMRDLIELTQRFWGELDDAAQREVLRGAFDESPDEFESLYRILDSYQVCVRRAERFHATAALELAAGPLAAHPLLDSERHRALVTLCERLGLRFAHRWVQYRNYPTELRTRQLDAWLQADDPSGETQAIEAAYRDGQRRRQPDATPHLTKLLPALPGENSFGWSVALQSELALILSSGVAVYRLTSIGWTREAFELPPATRVTDATLDGERILAILESVAPDGQASRRVAMFRQPAAGHSWREVYEFRLPAPELQPRHVGLSGSTAFVGASAENPPDIVYLFRRAATAERWELEQELDVGSAVRDRWRSRHSLDGDTLALESGYRDCLGQTTCSNTLMVFRRAPAAGWLRELEIQPPTQLGPRAVWSNVACKGDMVVAVASPVGSATPAALVLRRSDSGEWRQEADLCDLVDDTTARSLGNYLAIDTNHIALAACDQTGSARAFHFFARDSAAWRSVGAIDALDTAFSDRLGPVAADAGRLLIGAPAHDAAGIDTGAAYIVDLRSIERCDADSSPEP